VNTYTVEVTLTPVADDAWAVYRNVTDIVPGTILIEDPEFPVLILPVEAADPQQAAIFVQGIASIAGVQIVSGQVSDAPERDFDSPVEDDSAQLAGSLAKDFVPGWLLSV